MTGFATPVALWVYRSRNDGPTTEGFPFGTTNFTSGCTTDCYRYRWDASSGHFVDDGFDEWAVDACVAGGVHSVGVYVQVAHRSPVGLFGSRTLREHTNVRIEPLPLAQCSGP
jgi:hypothetical protein